MGSFHCVLITLYLQFGSLDSTLLETASSLSFCDIIVSGLVTMISLFSPCVLLILGLSWVPL